MAIEHEAKVLDIDHAEMESRIVNRFDRDQYLYVGERTMRRYVYDVEPGNDAKWLRLRDDGHEATLTLKHVEHEGIDGTHEVEIDVSDFQTTNSLLALAGFTSKAYQESRRRSWVVDGARIELDTWPGVPAFMEVEADSKDEVVRVAKLLGFDESELFTGSYYELYARYGIDLAAITDLRF